MELYSGKRVSKQTDIAYRTLLSWVEKGIIDPAVYRPGKEVKFSLEDIRKVLILRQLRKYLSMQQLRCALANPRKLGSKPLPEGGFAMVKNLPGEKPTIKIQEKTKAIQFLKEHPRQIELFPIQEIESEIEGILSSREDNKARR